MKKWFCAVALAPVSLLLPWLLPAWQGHRRLAASLLFAWLTGWALMLGLWAGPGFLLLLAMGLCGAYLTRI